MESPVSALPTGGSLFSFLLPYKSSNLHKPDGTHGTVARYNITIPVLRKRALVPFSPRFSSHAFSTRWSATRRRILDLAAPSLLRLKQRMTSSLVNSSGRRSKARMLFC